MGSGEISGTAAMIAGMNPALDTATWCFVSAPDQGQAFALMPHALATFREEEGLSLIVPFDAAQEAGIDAEPFRKITLQVHSALGGVGLTAAVSDALSNEGIACNVVAAYFHDHIFVPAARADDALAILCDLARESADRT